MAFQRKSDPEMLKRLERKVTQEKQAKNKTFPIMTTNSKTTSRTESRPAPQYPDKSDPEMLKRLERKVAQEKANKYTFSPTKVETKKTTAKDLFKQNYTDLYKYYSEKEDFAEKSKYIGTKGKYRNWWDKITEGSYGLGYGDLTYEYINDTEGVRNEAEDKARQYASDSPAWWDSGDSSQKDRGYDKMYPEEVAVYNYIYATEGKKKADEFLDEREMIFQQRSYEELTKRWEENADTVGGAILGSALSVPANIVGALPTLVETIYDAAMGKEYNPYSPTKLGTNYTLDTRKYVGENIAESTEGVEIAGQNVPSFLYSTGMSVTDSLVGALTLQKFSPLVGGTTAFHQKAKEMVEEGEEPNKVYATAFASGVAELLFEKVSIDNFFKIKDVDTIGKIVTSTLRQTGVEASEELLTELSNIITDTVIRGDTSEIAQQYQELIAKGYSEEEAHAEIAKTIGSQISWAAAGGALSGGTMGSVGSLASYSNSKIAGQKTNVAEKAEEIAPIAETTAKENGKKVTREQVEQLIESNEVYKKAEEQTTTPDTLEQAAKDVVLNRNERKGTPISMTVEEKSLNGTPISVKEAQKASAYGQNGSRLLANAVNTSSGTNGKSFSQIKSEMHTPYINGLANRDMSFNSDFEQEAYFAGKADRAMQDLSKKEASKKATIYDGTFTRNEHTKNWTEAQCRMVSIVAKSFGMDVAAVDKIIANEATGSEANAYHQDGKTRISSNAEVGKVIHQLVIHESGHRMRQLAPAKFGGLMDALYARAVQRAKISGARESALFDYVKTEHDNAEVTMGTSDYIEEIAVRELETIFSSAEEFNKWYDEISGNNQLKTNFEKIIDWVLEVIEDIRIALAQAKMTKEEREEARKALAELERIKELYANAYKAASDVVTSRKATQKAESKPSKADNKKGDVLPAQKETKPKAEIKPLNEGATKEEAKLKTVEVRATEAAFEAGKQNVPEEKAKLETIEQKIAYNNGKLETLKNMTADKAVQKAETSAKQSTPKKTTDVANKNTTQTKAVPEVKKSAEKVVEAKAPTEFKKYVSGNTGRVDGAIVDEIGNNPLAKSVQRDKSDITKAMAKVAGQTIEMDKPVEITYAPNANGNNVFAAFFAQTKDSRGGQIASVITANNSASFDEIYNMNFVNETGFMNTVDGKENAGTTRIEKKNFTGNSEAVKQIVNNILEKSSERGMFGQITFTMDDVDVNNFNDVSCALFSEVLKYLPEGIKTKIGFKSQSFGSKPQYVNLCGVNSCVGDSKAINIDHVGTATGKYMDVVNELFALSTEVRESALKTISQFTVEDLKTAIANAKDTNSAENIEIKENESYNRNISYSLKGEYWHTDLNKTQIKQVEKWLREAGAPEATRITDTANWYKGRIDGEDLLVIYSTENANNPTILYEVKGGKANLERDILMDLLEDEENGESINGKPSFTQRVSEGSWMQNVNDSRHNISRLGSGQDNQNAGILQGQSPRNGSRAFENVLRNIFKVQEQGRELNESKRYSLKGGMSSTEFFDAVDDARKGNKTAIDKLAKYVESGAIPTELYKELIEDYGEIDPGEKPAREVHVPKKTTKDKKVSQTVRTILEAKATPNEAMPTIEKMVEDGVFSYDVYTDKQAINDAESYIKEYGWDESLDDWFDAVNKGEVSKELTTMGWALYNNVANIAATTTSKTERTSAIKTSLKILDAMVRHQRSAAQALQATRILKKLSPETQLYGVQKSVEALQKELTDKYGDKAPDLKIDEDLAEQFINAKTPEERATIEKEIYKDIGGQMPSNWLDKWNAWRYLAMLGNPRTHIRNIVGNAAFAPVVGVKNLTATAIESAVYHVSGKKTLRGKALVWGSKTDRALLKAAWGDYANVADMVSNGGKYNDSAMANKHIEEGRQIFKFKPLEGARKGNSKLLEGEDTLFSKPHYAYALAQYCKANNITAGQIERGKAIAPARDYAIKEAQKATYKDTNAFSQMVSGWGRSRNESNVVKKTFNTAVEGILPFRKTPANILVRGVEYSPLELLKGLSYDLYQVSKGKMSSTEAIDNISAGLTGTGLLALGVYLAAQGIVRGHGEDEGEAKEFKEMMGHQSYSLELPNGQSITLDWLAPEALPFFVGVNLWETTNSSDENVNLSSILKSVSNISEPMLEMSCLQSLNDLFESVGYASSNDTSGLVSVLSSAATSYLTQGIPTLFGQAERTGEENRMTTYTEKNGFLTDDMQYTLGKASAKIPFWDYNQIPYIDAWGRKEASGTALKRGLNNFLNPAYTSTIETSKMEEELLRLYEQTGEGGVFPERADKYFTVDGVRKDLTAEEYVRYATLKGQKSYRVVADLVKSTAYKKLSDAEKAKAVKEAYDYANQKAKQAISNYKPQAWVNKADDFGNVGNYISFKTEVSGAKEANGGKISKTEVVDIILDMAQNDSETWKMYLSEYGSTSDMYAYNKGIDGGTYMDFLESLNDVDEPTESGKYGTYTQKEAERAIKQLEGLSQEEKAILWQSVNASWKAKNNPFR